MGTFYRKEVVNNFKMAAPLRKFGLSLPNTLLARCVRYHIPHTTGFRQVRRLCYEARQVDLKSSQQGLLFDTHSMVKQLEEAGMDLLQAEAAVSALVTISKFQMDFIHKNTVTKAQQEIMLQQIMAHIGSVKKDMIILEKSEFSQLKHEYEKQQLELKQLKAQFQDDIIKLLAGVKLDLNLEKSRSMEAHSANLRELQKLQNKLEVKDAETNSSVSSLDNKIDKEIANLLATYERYRNDIIKYAGGTILTSLTICLGFYRLWS